MKINLNEIEKSKINELINAKERNIDAANIYIAYLNDFRGEIDYKLINKYRKEFNNNLNVSFYKAFLDILEIDEFDDLYLEINANSKISSMKEINPMDYKTNPYYKNIKFDFHKEAKWEITNLYYLPYEGFVYDELDINEESNFEEVTPFGFFKDKFYYPAVIEKDTIWMSVIPHEINTMKKPIENSYGNVLVIGLGLGYFAYMVSLKNNVNKVTIIEKDKNVINLFNKYILPQFNHKEKIEIVYDDAFNFVDNGNLNKYHYCFVDIWHNVLDGEELYLIMKNKEKDHQNIKFDYWIEQSILAMIRRQIITLFEEELNGSNDDLYINAMDANDNIINKLHFILKNKEINNYQDLKNLLMDDSLKDLSTKLEYKEIFVN